MDGEICSNFDSTSFDTLKCSNAVKHSCDLLNTSQLKVMLWYRWSQLCLLTSYYREHRMAKASLNICVLSPCQTHFILNSKTKPLKTAAIRVFGSYSKFWTNLIYFHLCIFHTILIEFFLFFFTITSHTEIHFSYY